MGLDAWIYKYEKPTENLPIGKNVNDLYETDYVVFKFIGKDLTPYCTKVDLVETRIDCDALLKYLDAPEGAKMSVTFYDDNEIGIYVATVDDDRIHHTIARDVLKTFYYDVEITRYISKQTKIAYFRKEWGLHDMIIDLYHTMPDADPNRDNDIPLTQDMIEKINAFCEEFDVLDDKWEAVHIESMDGLFYEHSW